MEPSVSLAGFEHVQNFNYNSYSNLQKYLSCLRTQQEIQEQTMNNIDQNVSKAGCHRIIVRIWSIQKFPLHCDQIDRHEHRQSGGQYNTIS